MNPEQLSPALLPFLALALSPSLGAQVRPDAVMLRHPDVSRDEIAFRYDGDLWLVPKAGGTARRVTTAPGNESFPKFSPDGRTLAFVGGYDGGSDLYTLALDAGAPARVTQHPATEMLCDWTPDGASLLYWSSELSGIARAPKILSAPTGGGQPAALPVPYGTSGSLDDSGAWLAYTPHNAEFSTWKRYRGGLAGDIWLFNLKTGESRRVTDDPANDQSPMWHGRELIFCSDREHGVFNLFSYDLDTRDVRALTEFRTHDVKFPSVGPEDVVFEAAGKVYRLDLTHADRPRVPVDVVIPGERPQMRPRAHDVSDLVAGFSSGPGGVRLAVEARGDVWSVPVEGGATRNLTATSGVAERSPAWSPDGRYVAFFSDRSGEYEVTLKRADGKPFEGADEHGEKRLTELGPGWKDGLSWSPDSKKLLVGTSAGELYLHDMAAGTLVHVHTNPQGFPLRPDWSGDSGWLAWSHRHSQTRLEALYLHDVAQGRTHEVTSGMFDDSGPVFDRGGSFLYFTSSRTFDPLYGDLDTTWTYSNTRNLCAVPLRADVLNPFAPENHEEQVEGEEDEQREGEKQQANKEDDEDEDEDGKDKEEGEGKDGEDGEDAGKAEPAEPPEPVRIDLEGFEQRILILPVPAGRIAAVLGAKDKVVFLQAPRAGSAGGGEDEQEGQGGGESELRFLDLKADEDERKPKTILKGEVRALELTAQGKKLAVAVGDGLGVVDLAPDQTLKPADLSGLVAVIDARAEWAQILRDAWRLYRDFFYDPAMHGLDWDAVGERYAAALADATSRADVHYLIGEMMAELNVGHAYNDAPPGDMPEAGPARPVGLLGCDWTLADGAYRIERILGAAYDADARSPLAVPGVDARAGDYLLAVNGAPVDATRAVYAAFEGTAGKPTVLTLCAAPAADGTERDVLVEPLESEGELRYRAWVAKNRALVEERGGGRIGYVHVPDTGVHGQNELVRQFLGQQHKDALIIDERWNGGGQIPDRFIELLDRPLTNYWAVRQGEDWEWPPVGHHGPKAMLINYAAGSGGDCFPYFFRQRGLGKLIGTRTWGGLVGLAGNPSLIDGAEPTVPRFAFYELDGTWGVEGHGVEPDIEVIDDPARMRGGEDPQLLAAIEHLTGELEHWRFDVRTRPAAADRRGTGIKPEDR